MRSFKFLIVSFLLAPVLAAADTAEPAGHEHHAGHAMPAFYGSYPMSREASGTSWQPEAAPHAGTHVQWGDWSVMYHGSLQLVRTNQGGPRGAEDTYASNMLMLSGARSLGPGLFGLRGMFSLEPATIGKEGYPLLLQTGETADGETHLIDAQHPHDLFMELAATYSLPLDEGDSVFMYLGLPGEPALGPPAFMHRFSGVEFPDSPISHHWLDSTHIAFGVLTGGYARGGLKFELSSFTGREPDQHRYDIESPKFDSFSARLTWNPTANWSMQVSGGRLESPEQLEPDVDVIRYTASAMHSADTAAGHWQTTLAWGRNIAQPGSTLDAWVLESAWRFRPRHTVLARAEWVEKNELFADDGHDPGAPHFHAEDVFDVGRLSLGYVHDLWQSRHRAFGLGVLGTLNIIPRELEPVYGETPTAVTVFARLRF